MMARPKKQTVDYFPHETRASKTMFILENRWGNDGYAFFYKLLEMLCTTKGQFINYNDPAEREFLLAKTCVNEETATGILDKLAELGKIDQQLWKNGVIWYQALIDNIKDAYKKRLDDLPQKPVSATENTTLTGFPAEETPSNGVSGDGKRETKLKETKGNKTILIPYGIIVDAFNDQCESLPKVKEVTDQRKKAIKGFFEWLGSDIEKVKDYFRQVQESDYLCGRTDKPWTNCSFDWIIKPANRIKVAEGNYKNRGAKNGGNTKPGTGGNARPTYGSRPSNTDWEHDPDL